MKVSWALASRTVQRSSADSIAPDSDCQLAYRLDPLEIGVPHRGRSRARSIMRAMAMTPTYALAHVFIPNLLKLKGTATVISSLERKEMTYLDPLWAQAYVTHNPQIATVQRDPYRIAVFT